VTHRPGDRCPPLEHRLTAREVVEVSRAVRELRPVHLDRAAARAAGLPDVILGTSGQQLWLWRFLSDWFGVRARLVHLELRMRSPIGPGALVVDAEVVAADGDGLVDLALTMTIDGAPATFANATIDVTATAGWP
jgi:acyl dehydratase